MTRLSASSLKKSAPPSLGSLEKWCWKDTTSISRTVSSVRKTVCVFGRFSFTNYKLTVWDDVGTLCMDKIRK
jgi:hypothetical protein